MVAFFHSLARTVLSHSEFKMNGCRVGANVARSADCVTACPIAFQVRLCSLFEAARDLLVHLEGPGRNHQAVLVLIP